MKTFMSKSIAKKLEVFQAIFIFDYGGPLLSIHLEDKHQTIIIPFSEEELLDGALTIAQILSIHYPEEYSLIQITEKTVVCFGVHYIIIAILHFSAEEVKEKILWLKQFANYLDSFGYPVSLNDLERIVVDFLSSS